MCEHRCAGLKQDIIFGEHRRLFCHVKIFDSAIRHLNIDLLRSDILNMEIYNPIGVWFLLCYFLGMITWMLVSVKGLYNRRKIIKTKEREIKELMNELAQYRNQALEDDEEDSNN